jgi:hypothetical protein
MTYSAMLAELAVFLGAVGIAVAIFATIALLSDSPIRAFIAALILSYSLFFAYVFILEKIVKRKEENRVADARGE